MAFRDINSRKFAFLISHGTHEGELRKFFVDSKQQLLLKGAKVQNLPHGREERTRVISEKLSRKTDDLLRSWFQMNVSVAAQTSLEEVLMYLEAAFDEEEPLPENEVLAVCRSALSYLFEDTPDPRLLALLRRPMGPALADETTDPPPEESSPTQNVEPALATKDPENDAFPRDFQLAELIAAIIAGDEGAIDSALAPFSDGIRGMAEALLRIRAGDVEAARHQLSLLPLGAPESDLVQSALTQASHLQTTSSNPVGVRTIIPRPLEGTVEADQYDVIGIYVHETGSGAVFVEPLFAVIDGRLHHLTKEDRLRLFHESGSVMSHKPALRWPYKRGNLVRWKVSERDGADGKTRFHMDAELAPPIVVARLSVPSSDPDEVRARIKALAASGAEQTGKQTIFLLSDNVAIASPKGVDCTRDEAFERPWQAWSSLETWLIEGSQYCLNLPGGSASGLDLSPLDVSFRRLLRDLESEAKLTLSKAQKREIAELVRTSSGGETSHRAKRIAASIDQMAINTEDLEVVLNLLGSHADVRRKVDDLVAKELQSQRAENTGLQAEISALKKKKIELEKEGRDIARSNRLQADSTAASVRAAFDEAIRNGTAALANAEIFQILRTGREVKQSKTDEASKISEPCEQLERGALSDSEVKARLSLIGINGRQSLILSALSDLAESSGTALVLKGAVARECARLLIRVNRDAPTVVDVSMGLTSGDALRRTFSQLSGTQGLAVLNADLSPLEAYGGALLDSLMDEAASDHSRGTRVLMSCVGGDFSLPLPNILRRLSLVVDLDSDWDTSEQSLDEIEPERLLLFPVLQRKVWNALSKLDEPLRQHVERALVRGMALG